MLIDCGLSKLKWKFEEKDVLLKVWCSHFVINKPKASCDQFILGLKSQLAVYESILENPIAFSFLFTCRERTYFSFSDLRALIKIKFSPEGSNDRVTKEATAYWFEEMLGNTNEETSGFTARDLLAFVTGSNIPPPSGFGKLIDVEFYTQEVGIKRLPFTSTCALMLNLPRGISSQEEMENMMQVVLLQGLGFGKI